MNQIINMVIRQLVRRLVRMGVNKGVDAVAKRKPSHEASVAHKKVANENVKRAQKMMRMARRSGR